jgi:transposase
MYHTGFDVHDTSITIQQMDSDGALGRFEIIPSQAESIQKFLDSLDTLTTVTLEASGSHWWISQLLKQHPKVARVNVVDPRRSRGLAEELSVQNGYGRAKNDRIDGEMMAHETRQNIAPIIHLPTVAQMEVKTLNRYRQYLVESQSDTKRYIQSFLKMHGVKIKTPELIHNSVSQTNVLKSLSSVGELIVSNELKHLTQFRERLQIAEAKLKEILPATAPTMSLLLSQPGIGIVLARTIQTEICNIKNFVLPKYLNSYAGLAPVENDSNGKKGVIKLNCHCNYYLKYAFVQAAHCARKHPKYKVKYDRDVKKHGKMIAKLNLARRIVKSVYWMLIRQQPFRG